MTRSVRANICDLCPIVVILPELERDGLSGKLESMRSQNVKVSTAARADAVLLYGICGAEP